MATGAEVLSMLIPAGGWAITGDDFSGIEFLEAKPITEEEFKAGFSKVDAFKLAAAQKKSADRAALLERLGITAEEAALLLG